MEGLISWLRDTISFIAQLYPPRPTFAADQIPDLTGQVVLVTGEIVGGNTGIGEETVKVLLQHNAKVYLAARSKEKANVTIAGLKELTGREALFLELDLSSLASVKKAAEHFLSREQELHVLYNNAGVMRPPLHMTTADGYDLQFGTNVIGHFYLTKLLMPALLAGKDTSPDHHPRVITVSSSTAYFGSLDWDTFKEGPTRRKQSTAALYSQSKLANAVVAHELAKRYADKGIISISLNPGSIDTNILRHSPPIVRKLALATVSYPTSAGALTQLWAGTMPEAVNYNGEFLIPFARPGRCTKKAYDPIIGKRLWDWLEEQIEVVNP